MCIHTVCPRSIDTFCTVCYYKNRARLFGHTVEEGIYRSKTCRYRWPGQQSGHLCLVFPLRKQVNNEKKWYVSKPFMTYIIHKYIIRSILLIWFDFETSNHANLIFAMRKLYLKAKTGIDKRVFKHFYGSQTFTQLLIVKLLK